MRFLLLLGFLISSRAVAYPEMVRHGYFNCTTCHVSPNGGGVLTEYGRALSREVVSTWGIEGEGKPFYGLYTEPEWLRTGASFRVIQTYLNDPNQTKETAFPMQAEVEAAATVGEWTLAVTGGAE